MKDNLQGISHDRILMRIKDYLTIIGILFTWVFGTFVGTRYVIRMIDRIGDLERQVSELQTLSRTLNKKR